MAALTIQTSSLTGLNPSYVAAAGGGDTFVNDGATVLHVKNGGGSSINVTADQTVACNYGFDHDNVVSVPNGGERIIGPFSPNRFGATVSISYSGVTTVTVAAIKV